MLRPKLLDLFCGAGGAAMGYHRAGFEIVGVDIESQPRFPFEFIQGDALEFPLKGFDAIHASPPCQRYSPMTRDQQAHPDLVAEVRAHLLVAGIPYIIENVPGAPLRDFVTLCGSSFGLKVRRHRLFEANFPLLMLPCNHAAQGRPITITGNSGGRPYPHSWKGVKSEWPTLMGMPWASPKECTQAIPPAYTEYIGRQLLGILRC